jgi:hypothetical protein
VTAAADLPIGWNYVRTGVVWHIAADETLHIPGDLALCGKRAHWRGNTRGAWAVGKLCRACRVAWEARA